MAIKGKNMLDLKQSNRAAILMLLHEQGSMSRKQIAHMLSLTPAAITMIVAELIEEKLIVEGQALQGNGNAGRKEILVDISGEGLFAIGISFGIENAVISTTDSKGNLLSNETFLFDYDGGAEYIIHKACGFVEKTIHQREQQGQVCIGVGVAMRGLVNETEGVCVNSYGAWPESNVPVKQLVAACLPDYNVYLRQNVRALAETYIFNCRDEVIESMLFVKNDTGIGSALVIGHKVYGGYNSKASELGHITVDEQGKPCRCGSIGCLETIASCRAIEADVRSLYGEESTPVLFRLSGGRVGGTDISRIMAAAEAGDESVKRVVDKAIEAFGKVLRAHIDVLDIQKLILHGEIFHCAYFFNGLKQKINFDGRYTNLDSIVNTTGNARDLNIKCSPVLVIKAFYGRGGGMERNQ